MGGEWEMKNDKPGKPLKMLKKVGQKEKDYMALNLIHTFFRHHLSHVLKDILDRFAKLLSQRSV